MNKVVTKTRKLRRARKAIPYRFAKNIHGEFAFVEYHKMGDTIILTHTEVPPKYRKKGYGTKMVMEILDDLQRVYKRIVPVCPFIENFIDENPQYHLMVERWQA